MTVSNDHTSKFQLKFHSKKYYHGFMLINPFSFFLSLYKGQVYYKYLSLILC